MRAYFCPVQFSDCLLICLIYRTPVEFVSGDSWGIAVASRLKDGITEAWLRQGRAGRKIPMGRESVEYNKPEGSV